MANNLLLVIGLVLLGGHLGHSERQNATLFKQNDQPLYVVGWDVDQDKGIITFDVWVKTTGFIGFGLAPIVSMKDADFFIGGVYPNGTAYFTDRYSAGTAEPLIDSQQDWILEDSWEREGATYMKFSRALDTCDKEDMIISADTLNIIWSFGPTDEIAYHGGSRGGQQFNLFDPPEPAFDTNGLEKWEVRVNDEMPDDETTYLCTIHKLRKFETKKHMIALEAYLDDANSVAHTHHFTATGCDLKDPEVLKKVRALQGQPGQVCYEPIYKELKKKCNNILFGWAVGGKRIVLPEHLGVPVGDPDVQEEQFIMFEVHYNNPERKKGIKFTSGFNVYFTEHLREVEGSVIMIGVDILPALFVPPRQETFTLSGHCSSQYTKEFLPADGINIVSVNMHSHLAGRKLKVRHYRDGVELPWLLSDDHYDFDYQQTRQLAQEVKLMPGDQLTMECVMSTRDRTEVTMGGESTHDEMCHVFLFYYPKIDLVACRSFYPMDLLFHKFGIIDYDHDSEPLNPTITKPAKMAGKTFREIANKFDYTPRFVKKLQEDMRHADHIATYVIPAGAGAKYNSPNTKYNMTNYPVVSKEYARPASECARLQGGNNKGHSLVSSIFAVFTAIASLFMLNRF